MSSVRLAALAALLGCASAWGAVAHAQVYRIVGPDGRVTFSDRPPPDANATPAPSMPLPASTSSGGAVALPTELRNAATRFPVTLYTAPACGPCETARSFLSSRGIPFTEKTVSTDADVRAVRNLSGGNSLPFATIGGQHLIGFSESEWAGYIDAAGYPRSSQLPPGYRNPPATPVVAVETTRRTEPTPQAAARPQSPAAPQPLPSDPSPTNPLGIRF